VRSLTPTLEWAGDHLRVLDQTLLPDRVVVRDLRTVDDVVDALRRLVIRGAPAIGVCGAYGVVMGLDQHVRAPAVAGAGPARVRAWLEPVAARLSGARPTAVNLGWAVGRTAAAAAAGGTATEARAFALAEAERIREADVRSCRLIGEHGRDEMASVRRVLTHCNAGRLATAGWGTALGVVYAKADAGQPVEVFATETRPLLQGARLTAWELGEAGIPVTLLTDGAVGAMMRSGRIEAVVVGCDRVATNGDTANKIGTYTCALAAQAHGVPFYVAGPISSFDPVLATGDGIEIEVRGEEEVRRVGGAVVAAPAEVWNPAFDVTPGALVTAFITDVGVLRPPYRESIGAALEEAERLGLR